MDIVFAGSRKVAACAVRFRNAAHFTEPLATAICAVRYEFAVLAVAVAGHIHAVIVVEVRARVYGCILVPAEVLSLACGRFFGIRFAIERGIGQIVETYLNDCLIYNEVHRQGERAFFHALYHVVGVVEGYGNAARIAACRGHGFLSVAAACGYGEYAMFAEACVVCFFAVIAVDVKTGIARICERQRSERSSAVHSVKGIAFLRKCLLLSLIVDVVYKRHASLAYVKRHGCGGYLDVHISALVIGVVEVGAFKAVHNEQVCVGNGAHRGALDVLVAVYKSVREPAYDLPEYIRADRYDSAVGIGIRPTHRYILTYFRSAGDISSGCTAVFDVHIVDYRYSQNKRGFGDGYYRMGNVGYQRARAVVIFIAVEDNDGEVITYVGGGGSSVHGSELITGIFFRFLCKPFHYILCTGSDERVHHSRNLFLRPCNVAAAAYRSGQIVDGAVFRSYIGSGISSVKLKRIVACGNGIAFQAVRHVVFGLLEPDGGISLVYGDFHRVGRRDVIVFATRNGHLYPIGACAHDRRSVDIHVIAVRGILGEGYEYIHRALQRRVGNGVAARGNGVTYCMGIAVEGGNVSACFIRPHEIGTGYDHVRLCGYPGDLEEHVDAAERAFKVGFCVLGPFSRRGYRDAVFTDGTDDFNVGPYVAVRGIFYCRDGNFVRGVIFARKALKRLIFDAQTHAPDYVIVPGRVGSIRL